MIKTTSMDLSKFLTIELSSEDLKEDYLRHVWNWIDILINRNLFGDIYEDLIYECFSAKISTLDTARYIVDKNLKDQNSYSQVFVKFDTNNFITSSTIFIENGSDRMFIITAKMEGEYILLKALKRIRTHRGISPYELRKTHLSELNKNYRLFRY